MSTPTLPIKKPGQAFPFPTWTPSVALTPSTFDSLGRPPSTLGRFDPCLSSPLSASASARHVRSLAKVTRPPPPSRPPTPSIASTPVSPLGSGVRTPSPTKTGVDLTSKVQSLFGKHPNTKTIYPDEEKLIEHAADLLGDLIKISVGGGFLWLQLTHNARIRQEELMTIKKDVAYLMENQEEFNFKFDKLQSEQVIENNKLIKLQLINNVMQNDLDKVKEGMEKSTFTLKKDIENIKLKLKAVEAEMDERAEMNERLEMTEIKIEWLRTGLALGCKRSRTVIDDALCEQRLWDMKRRGDQNFYMCEVRKDFKIDATFKGNASRFLNHSCDPNCQLEKWQVDGETRVGVFASRPIDSGEPLTYDYRFEHFGPMVKCFCGASSC